jgi:hypothetical protein
MGRARAGRAANRRALLASVAPVDDEPRAAIAFLVIQHCT